MGRYGGFYRILPRVSALPPCWVLGVVGSSASHVLIHIHIIIWFRCGLLVRRSLRKRFLFFNMSGNFATTVRALEILHFQKFPVICRVHGYTSSLDLLSSHLDGPTVKSGKIFKIVTCSLSLRPSGATTTWIIYTTPKLDSWGSTKIKSMFIRRSVWFRRMFLRGLRTNEDSFFYRHRNVLDKCCTSGLERFVSTMSKIRSRYHCTAVWSSLIIIAISVLLPYNTLMYFNSMCLCVCRLYVDVLLIAYLRNSLLDTKIWATNPF